LKGRLVGLAEMVRKEKEFRC